jgi:hypothetical protein
LKFSVRLFAYDHDLVVDEAGAVMQEGPEPLLESFETNIRRRGRLGKLLLTARRTPTELPRRPAPSGSSRNCQREGVKEP